LSVGRDAAVQTPDPVPGAGRNLDLMLRRLRNHDRFGLLADASLYVAAAVLPLGIIASLMGLRTADLSAPFVYGGDALFSLAWVKGFIQTGSYLTNPSLGAPGIAQFYDMPNADGLNFLAMRVIGLFGMSPGTIVNIFYLAGYSAVGVATAFVLRRLHVSRPSSLGVAVLFALLPYHYMRGEGHLFLSMYWIIPLLLLVLVWLDSSDPPLVKHAAGGWFPFTMRNRRSIAALVICLAAGACGVYYWFFGSFFIAVVGLRAALRRHSFRVALAAAALILASGLVFAAQMVPSFAFWAQYGKNTVASVRNPFEAETYGLRITQMLLPIDDHRVASLAAMRATYRSKSADGNNEANMAALGLVGSLGFLLSISALVLGWPRTRRRRQSPPKTDEPVSLRLLGVLTVSGVLLGTVAGFGAVFAAAVTPEIRAYNRISVYIALFALVTLGVLVDRLLGLRKRAAWHVAGTLVITLVVILGVLDQTPASLEGLVRASAAGYAADVTFGQQVQAVLPSGGTVFQLPYRPFPEFPPVFGMTDYDPVRGYLNTTGLHWSYAAMKGRPDAAWQEATAALPAPAMVERLRASGFNAIWVQLNGYENGGTSVRAALDGLLGAPAAVSSDGVFAVWRL
jgi:phosphoglycerol transferase